MLSRISFISGSRLRRSWAENRGALLWCCLRGLFGVPASCRATAATAHHSHCSGRGWRGLSHGPAGLSHTGCAKLPLPPSPASRTLIAKRRWRAREGERALGPSPPPTPPPHTPRAPDAPFKHENASWSPAWYVAHQQPRCFMQKENNRAASNTRARASPAQQKYACRLRLRPRKTKQSTSFGSQPHPSRVPAIRS